MLEHFLPCAVAYWCFCSSAGSFNPALHCNPVSSPWVISAFLHSGVFYLCKYKLVAIHKLDSYSPALTPSIYTAQRLNHHVTI